MPAYGAPAKPRADQTQMNGPTENQSRSCVLRLTAALRARFLLKIKGRREDKQCIMKRRHSESPPPSHSPPPDNDMSLDPTSLRRLATALGVDPAYTPAETLAYSILCKSDRGEAITKAHLRELWDAIPTRNALS